MKIKKLTFGAMCLAMSLLLPQVFHLAGYQQAGAIFLPMHLPIFIGGMLLGPLYGLFLGVFAPLTSFVVTGMPSGERVLFMMCELATYGTVCGLMFSYWKWNQRKLGALFVVLISQAAGRSVYALVIALATYVFKIPFGGLQAVISATLLGIPGIIIQLLMVPIVVVAIEKGGYFHEFEQVTKRA